MYASIHTCHSLHYSHNYPVGTDMSAKVRTETGDAATRQMFEQLLNTDSYVRCDNSADKMIETLIRNDFPSGAHIDYFD